MNIPTINPTALRDAWLQLQQLQPGIRIRNAAKELQVSEAELLVTLCGETVTRLRPAFPAILTDVTTFGRVMALTRNDEIVHERKGVYLNPEFHGSMGLFHGDDIDLRIFLSAWAFAFAVTETANGKLRYSLQFFNSSGEAVHKIYLVADSNFEAYEQLVARYTSEDQSDNISLHPAIKKTVQAKGEMQEFKKEWIALQDTHDFFGLINKYGLTRLQALENAPQDHAIRLTHTTFRKALTSASSEQLPVMIFVGNEGMLQIHTGEVKHIVDRENWLNVLDPDFNLHVNEPAIDQVWLVRKPTKDGIVTSLELFSAEGELILQLFGKRKPGIPEDERWLHLTNELSAEKINMTNI